MTATEARQLPCRLLQKFTLEERPPATMRRDDRIRSVASSFEEITESEEEELQEIPSVSSWNGGRSPYALQHESPFAQRRSNSLSNNPLVSPKFNRKIAIPRLTRGFSDPVMRRKSSFPGLSRLSPERSTTEDLLSLPPIPEAATPASPVSSGPPSLFKEPSPGKENSPARS